MCARAHPTKLFSKYVLQKKSDKWYGMLGGAPTPQRDGFAPPRPSPSPNLANAWTVSATGPTGQRSSRRIADQVGESKDMMVPAYTPNEGGSELAVVPSLQLTHNCAPIAMTQLTKGLRNATYYSWASSTSTVAFALHLPSSFHVSTQRACPTTRMP